VSRFGRLGAAALAVLATACAPLDRDDASDTDPVAAPDTDVAIDTDSPADTDGPVEPGPYRPFPQRLTYPGAALRVSGSQGALDQAARDAYDRWKSRYLTEAPARPDGTARMRVRMANSPAAPTVSEGQGYGVVIVTLMAGHDPDAQPIVDALLAYFDDHRSHIDSRLMDWKVPADEAPSPDDDDSAFDGDADLAYGLLLADAQWGSRGAVDYHAKALDLLDGILQSEVGPDSHLPMLGDWVDPDGETFNQWTTRSSDWMPEHFRAFAAATGDDAWLDVADATLDLATVMQRDFAPNTGLLPDFVVGTEGDPKPATPGLLEDETDGQYGYNAGRVPWRLGFDALVHEDPRAVAAVGAISSWIDDATVGDPLDIAPGYDLSGAPVMPRLAWTSFFAAPFAVAAMTDPTQQAWLNAVYGSVAGSQEGYYEDTVTLQCLLVVSGNAWTP
jgi:endo-1,4-beta-D-glucanase Y